MPTSEHRGNGKAVQGGRRFAFLYGYSREFTPKELKKLYKNQQAFKVKYDQALEQSIESGVVLTEDGPGMREIAETWAKTNLKGP